MSDSERRPLELPRYGNDMAGDLLAWVFEPFANPDSPLFNRGDRPSLAIVQQFAWAHDGEIWAESEPGQGTPLSLRIPCLTRNPSRVISDDPASGVWDTPRCSAISRSVVLPFGTPTPDALN